MTYRESHTPKWAATIDGVRRYRNPNRHEGNYAYWSVTNVTGSLPKPALINWAAKVVATKAIEDIETLRTMVAWEAVDWLKREPNRVRDRAAAKGTTIHKVMDNLLHGLTYEVEGLAEPWIAAAERFVSEARPRPIYVEQSLYHEGTMTAGTIDFYGRLDAAPELGRVLIDWKTSRGIYEDMAVQLVGGYSYMDYALDNEGHEIEFQRPDSALIVHLTPEGYAIRPVPIDKSLRRAFLGAAEIRKWEDIGPQIGPPYQLKLDMDGPALGDMPSNAELDHIKSRLRGLTSEQQLAVSAQCVELGITTKLKEMTVTDADRLLGLIGLYEMGEPIADEPQHAEERRGARRPMP